MRLTSEDYQRLGRKFNKYLLAEGRISKTIKKIAKEPSKEIDELLKDILHDLNKAFNSELGFFTDENRKILYSTLPGNRLKDQIFPQIDRLEIDGYIVIDHDSEKQEEIASLNFNSVLVVRFKFRDTFRLIGVANNKNEQERYLSEDLKFFQELMNILVDSLDYGHKMGEEARTEAELEFSSDRYVWACIKGEWEYLSKDSGDYANDLLRSKSKNLPKKYDEDVKHIENFRETHLDSVLTDFLDGKLCGFIQNPKIKANKDTRPIRGETGKLSKEPWKVFKPVDENTFKILLKGTRRDFTKLGYDKFPCASLAIARIFLFAENYCVESALDNSSQKMFSSLEWSELKNLFDIPVTVPEDSTEDYFFHWQVDWLRNKWQQIYYLARKGMLEPGEDKIKEIDSVYSSIHGLSIEVIRNYLENENSEAELCIDSDWLISWFAVNALLSKKLNLHYGLEPKVEPGRRRNVKINPITKVRYIKHLSHHILYVLHCARHARRKSAIEGIEGAEHFKRPPFSEVIVEPTSSLSIAQLFLISEYAYREIGVHRELRIFERLSRQLTHELPLYAASNFYRDHLYHVVDVCLLGDLMLRGMLETDDIDKKYLFLSETLGAGDIRDLFRNWYVAALCHDLGYVVEQSDKFLKPVGEIQGPGLSGFSSKLKEGLTGGKDAIRDTIRYLVEHGLAGIPSDLAMKLVDDEISTDHGVAAWLHLRQWVKDIEEPPDSYEPALTAILRHNLSDQEVSLKDEPLTFLLMLCDHLQEWGRPRVGPEPLARGIMEGLRFAEKPDLTRKVRMNAIHITGLKPEKVHPGKLPAIACDRCIMKGTGDCRTHCIRFQTVIDTNKGLTFTLPHVEAREADFEPCISWLLFCRDLQCFKSPDESHAPPISIVMKHAPPRIWSSLGWDPLEMDIFEEYANTHPKATYLCKWIEYARRGAKGIKYTGNRKKGEESFSIDLHKLEKPLSRDLSNHHWKEFFQWKWQWLSHKYATANLGRWFPE